MWSTARSEAALLAEFPVPIDIRVIRGARRLRLRFDEAAGTLKLTCPPRTSRGKALAWALDQRDWIDAQLARAVPPEPFEPGAHIPIDGDEVLLRWDAAAPRTPGLVDGILRCGGPADAFSRRIETWLKRRALSALSGDTRHYGELAGIGARAVSVGDPASRWGSCSSEGKIRFSWRLILAPPQVRRYVVAHEVAHLVHLNHGAEFKALEAKLFGPGVAEAKALLRRWGPRLRRVGRGRR